MKRFALAVAVVGVGLAVSSCAVGIRKTATYVSDTGAVLNGNAVSTAGGPGSYYVEYGPTLARENQTPTRTFDFTVGQSHPLSEPIDGLASDTTYHLAVCAEDGENPGDPQCSPDRTFHTGSAGGRSGIVWGSGDCCTGEIWAMDADGGNKTKLTNTPENERDPTFSPDGKSIAYVRDDDIWVMNSDGTNQRLLLVHPTIFPGELAWSPDGSKIAYHGFDIAVNQDTEIYVTSSAGGGEPVALTDNTAEDAGPTWSPDGEKITFHSTRDDPDHDIFVMDADGSNQTMFSGGESSQTFPAWSPDRLRIAFGGDLGGDTTLGIYTAAVLEDGTGATPEFEASAFASSATPTWARDGNTLAWQSLDADNDQWDIFRTVSGGVQNLTDSAAQDTRPDWSLRP